MTGVRSSVLTERSAFNSADRHRRLLTIVGAVCAVLGVLLTAPLAGPVLFVRLRPSTALPAAVGLVGPALLLAAAAALSAALIALARGRVLAATVAPHDDPIAGRATLRTAALPAAWPQTGLALLFSFAALAGVLALGRAAGSDQPSPQDVWVGGACLLAAFPLLVLERHYAGIDPAELPEAPEVGWMLRVPLAVLLAVGIGCLLLSAGFRFSVWIERCAALLVFLVASEVAARAAAGAFLPPAPADAPRHAVRSALARLIRPTTPSISAMGGAIDRQFGIDLSRSWALGFLRRAALPALAGLGVAGWALTGVTALRLDERAVYQRLGEPVAVLRPGLHLHLPWPFGTIRRVELDVMHELPLVLAAETGPAAPRVDAEAMPPASRDRLWDQSHPSEAAYLVASVSRGQQGFQVVDIDLRLVFRVGASDQAARDAAYRVAAPERLMRAAAGRILVRYFATHTLLGVLGEDRDAFTMEVRTALQRELDGLSTGLELVAVIVEAIHPPPAAAGAYQNVQAAEIRVRGAVSAQQGEAAKVTNAARQSATGGIAAARVAAAETAAEAQAQRALFAADRVASGRHPDAFLLERRLERLGQGLGRGQLIVLDHRIEGADAPTLDMRPPAAPATP